MEVERLTFAPGDSIPNNADLSALAYRGVEEAARGPAACERMLTTHGWGGTWRSTVFGFHHFHSTSHEALAVAAGEATLALGGPQGDELGVSAGDVLVLPAGTGHMRVNSSEDFLVVGAYPPGQEDYDLRRGDPAELEEVLRNIAAVELPATDPVVGAAGPLIETWT